MSQTVQSSPPPAGPQPGANDAAASIVLILATVAALVFANTALRPLYHDFLATPVEMRIGAFALHKPLVLWIDEGLMAVFFFLVGLEIKVEFAEGALSSRDRAVLPLVAALGGMAVPAAIYVFVARNDTADRSSV